ncbi:MAG: hypothetical protein ACRD3F_12045 [Acidobacteriaceae bacterium]
MVKSTPWAANRLIPPIDVDTHVGSAFWCNSTFRRHVFDLSFVAPADPDLGTYHLVICDLQIDAQPGVIYTLYLHVSEGVSDEELAHTVGDLNFFQAMSGMEMNEPARFVGYAAQNPRKGSAHPLPAAAFPLPSSLQEGLLSDRGLYLGQSPFRRYGKFAHMIGVSEPCGEWNTNDFVIRDLIQISYDTAKRMALWRQLGKLIDKALTV